jgi:quercetin dioxygenase-like cupin family protein
MKKEINTIAENQGKTLKISGGEYRIIISGKETDGAYAIIEMNVPIGAGPIPHSHTNFDEIFYVVEGEVLFKSETASFLAQKGSTVSIPKGGIIHNFKNNSDQPAKLLCTVIPAGLDDFFLEISDLLSSGQMNDPHIKESITLISEKFGQKLYSPNFWDL